MTDRTPRPGFPERGDNFVTRGHWRIQAGSTWHDMQLAAEKAHARAASAAGDELSARRAEGRVTELKAAGPRPVRPVTG